MAYKLPNEEALVDKDYAMLIHRNHDQVISELKERQWRVIQWVVGLNILLATGFASYPQIAENQFAPFISVMPLVISLVGSIAIFDFQLGMTKRREELKHLKQTIGTAYTVLRPPSKKDKGRISYGWPIWFFLISLMWIFGFLSFFLVIGVPKNPAVEALLRPVGATIGVG